MIPLILGGLIALAAYKHKKKKVPVMTPQREIIYNAALTAEKDPDKLKDLAKAFRAEGLTAQADLLDKRAALRLLPPDVQAARKAVVKDMLNSDNPVAVAQMAGEFDKVGASGVAHALRQHASGLIAKRYLDAQSSKMGEEDEEGDGEGGVVMDESFSDGSTLQQTAID